MSVVIETTLGDITIDLFLKERPNTCLNFLKLCKVKYYNFCVFYKLERNFIAQTGDPTCTGRGGESIFSRIYGNQAAYFEAELKPRLKHEKLGTLSMVNDGNNMNGSQFFITLGENLTYLDEVHTVFGEVAEGFETLLKINEAICDPNSRPYQDILITHTVILHDPYDDPPGLEIPDASPLPTKEQLESNYIGADEEIDDTKGKSVEEIEEKIKESEAQARATILEMVGDIPDADVKPPETVLFVCKLNPVTTSEDLEIIFSRFGLIKSCEVIKDKKTGESLQYAFIEFEKEEDCENAYFKMDNVLIDDRRIHVDFSQSVSKMMLEKGNTFSKNKNSKNEMFVIKSKEKKVDGYDMIFDMDEECSRQKKKEKISDWRNKRHDSRPQISSKRSRKRSHSFDKRHSEYLKESQTYHGREYNRSEPERENVHRMSKHSTNDFAKSSTADRHRKNKHSRSSSDHSVSPLNRQNTSEDKVLSASKYSHYTEKFHKKESKKRESVSNESKERRKIYSRHKSTSSESDVPTQRSKIRNRSRSPESLNRKTNKSKHASSSERSRSYQRQNKHLSRKQSSSPESDYANNTKQVKKSSKHCSRSHSSEKYADDSKIKSSSRSHEKTDPEKGWKHTKKSKKDKRRNKSSSSSDSDNSVSNIKSKGHYSSHSKNPKSSHNEYKHRR